MTLWFENTDTQLGGNSLYWWLAVLVALSSGYQHGSMPKHCRSSLYDGVESTAPDLDESSRIFRTLVLQPLSLY